MFKSKCFMVVSMIQTSTGMIPDLTVKSIAWDFIGFVSSKYSHMKVNAHA